MNEMGLNHWQYISLFCRLDYGLVNVDLKSLRFLHHGEAFAKAGTPPLGFARIAIAEFLSV
ncbi:MAG: hypothetical protein AB8B70_11275 [Prochlorococcus sp.]